MDIQQNGRQLGSKERSEFKSTEFLKSLHLMLDSVGILCPSTTMHWSPDGNGFVVNDWEDLFKNTIPLFFPDVHKIDSFKRKLNRGGIFMTRKGIHKGVWRHGEGTFYRGSHVQAPAASAMPVPLFADSSDQISDSSYLAANEDIDDELADFFCALENSITDDMMHMDYDRLSLVRTSTATVLVALPELAKP